MALIYWNPDLTAGSFDYNVATNWSPNVVPGSLDTAILGGSNFSVQINQVGSTDVGEWMVTGPLDVFLGPNSNVSLRFFGAGIVDVDRGDLVLEVRGPYDMVGFYQESSAGATNIFAFTSFVKFFDRSTAGNANIIVMDGAAVFFNDVSSAGNATITTKDEATTFFQDFSTGGNAELITKFSGVVDFSGSLGPAGDHRLTVGSMAGAGQYILGANQLTVGLNNLSTEVSGLITDGGGLGAGTGGSLVKVGYGTLKLSGGGSTTYTGGTTLEQGTLDIAAVGAAGSGAITFSAEARATLVIENAALSGRSLDHPMFRHIFGNPIDDFSRHEIIDLSGLHFRAGATATYNTATHHLSVHSGSLTDTLTLHSPQGTQFATASDGHGGTDVFLLFS